MWLELAPPPSVSASFVAVARGEIDGAFSEPGDELLDFRVGFERIDGREVAGEFGLGKQRVNFAMADGVEEGDGAMFAAF